MNEAHIDESGAGIATPTPAILGPGQPEGIVVVITMRPERVFVGEDEGEDAAPVESLAKAYKTSSWFFASDFLDRVTEAAAAECSGLKVRPVEVAITFELDAKAYRHVDLVLDTFDTAYRAI